MGLASSQARMLLLTARKSDLEYRAQMISQRKINLAMQTQTLASTYSDALRDQVMKFTYTTANGESMQETLSYAGITSQNANFVGDYIVKTANGKYAASSDEDALTVAVKVANAERFFQTENKVTRNYYQPEGENGQKSEMTYDNLKKENYLIQVSDENDENYGKFLASGIEDQQAVIAMLVKNDGKTLESLTEEERQQYNDRVVVDNNNSLLSSDSLGQAYDNKKISVVKFTPAAAEGEKGTYDNVSLKERTSETKRETVPVVLDKSSMSNAQKSAVLAEFEKRYGEISIVPALKNAAYFQDALRNGALFLFKKETSDETGYKSLSWSADRNISDVADTSNDAEAQAEYEAKSLVLSNQDKMLDLELNQIETQHKAIETEYDSVKKVIEKNIDVSYKIFA